jgi:ABC-type polysaccharide/polyol phosphate transport system ATPase subunit
VSLAVAHGETLGLLGPNGAGKSTALKLMARILVPDRGVVHIDGRTSALIELGAGFLMEYTGRENVYLNASLLGMSRRQIDDRYRSIVEFAELEDHIDSPLRTYSSGMYMRLGFSVAIHAQPEILLIDEVLAVGDEAFQRKCLDWLESFKRRAGTIVLVTHSLAALREMCSRVAWIDGGGLRMLGEPHEVIDRYLDDVREMSGGDQRLHVLGSAAEDRAVPIKLGEARLLDAKGRPAHHFQSGETVVLEIPYLANRRIETPVFGVALYRNDGSYVYGTNTAVDGQELGPVEGFGRLRLIYRDLSLLTGTYRITIAVFTDRRATAGAVDFQEQQYSFRMTSGTGEQGTVRLAHDWELMTGDKQATKTLLGS